MNLIKHMTTVYLTFCNSSISSMSSPTNMVYIKNPTSIYEGVIASIISSVPNIFIPS